MKGIKSYFAILAFFSLSDYINAAPFASRCGAPPGILSSYSNRDTFLRDGIYIGLGIDYDSYKINQKISLPFLSNAFLQRNTFLFESDVTSQMSAYSGNFLLGYGQYFDRFYYGGEIFAEQNRGRSHTTIFPYHNHLAASISYGVSLLPGFRINNSSLFYLRVGVSRLYLRMSEYDFGIPVFSTKNGSGIGINVGFGIETALYHNVSLRADSMYATVTKFDSNVNTTFDISKLQYTLALIYHFCC